VPVVPAASGASAGAGAHPAAVPPDLADAGALLAAAPDPAGAQVPAYSAD
jgi:hypothetical protein